MRKKMICFTMACLLMISAATPKKAYAIAGVDDVAVAIVLALAAAAGITFATSDGAKDAVKDFLKSSDGKYDSTLERLSASSVTAGGLSCFKIPVATWSGVKLILEGLFSHFKVDENRKGAVSVAGSSSLLDLPYCILASDPSCISFFKLKDLQSTDTVYCFAWVLSNSSGKPDGYVRYDFISRSPFSFSYFDDYNGKRESISSFSCRTKECVRDLPSGIPDYFYSRTVLCADTYDGNYRSELFGLSLDDVFCTSYGTFRSYDSEFLVARLFGFSNVVEKSIPYGLTFPQDMSAPDVIDNFEQKVKEGAGDTAIAVPVDGVVDGTLPYDVAQEKYLVNVNELGEIGDTVTETNTWLQKILSSVKAIPAAVSSAVVGSGILDFSGFQNIGLSTVFPFCIPFDFVNCIRYFAVSEQVPQWSVDLSGSPLAAFGVFKINFERFTVWAKLLKFFLYSIFVVGLVKLTRHLIKG